VKNIVKYFSLKENSIKNFSLKENIINKFSLKENFMLKENTIKKFSLKRIIIALVAILICVSAGAGTFLYLKRDVIIDDGGVEIHVGTMENTVEKVLEENGISVGPEDYINPPLDTELHKTKINEIQIKRAVPVYVSVDGQELELMTYKDTVREVLEDNSIELYENDRLEGACLDDKITEGMQVKIVRVEEKIVTENEQIPYEVVSRANSRMEKGKQKIVTDGKEGVKQKSFKVVIEDGIEVSRELIKEEVVTSPVDKVVEYGTYEPQRTSRGKVLNYKKVLDMRATAYTASYKDTGKNPDDPQFGITYTGIKAKKGVVAVDPSIIPLGTRLYIEGVGNTPDYGYAVAADIGGAVKGNIIDLYMEDPKESQRWGVRKVKVYILD